MIADCGAVGSAQGLLCVKSHMAYHGHRSPMQDSGFSGKPFEVSGRQGCEAVRKFHSKYAIIGCSLPRKRAPTDRGAGSWKHDIYPVWEADFSTVHTNLAVGCYRVQSGSAPLHGFLISWTVKDAGTLPEPKKPVKRCHMMNALKSASQHSGGVGRLNPRW